jgi:hypothetical protein
MDRESGRRTPSVDAILSLCERRMFQDMNVEKARTPYLAGIPC